MQTIYVVETYKNSDGEIWPERAVICRNDQDAIRRARMFSEDAAGVVAYSQEVNPDACECSAPVVLAQYGAVPLGSRVM